MKRAIVTGANGFVGSALVKELLLNNYTVYAVVRGEHKDQLPTADNLFVVSSDLCHYNNLAQILPQTEYDIFFHLAWQGSAGQARSDISLQLQNAKWTTDALQSAKELGIKRFISTGSIMEHESLSAVYSEGNRPGMAYIYGISKLTAHMMSSSLAANLGIDLVWPVITNAYGVGELSPRIVNSTIRKCIHNIPPEFTAAVQNYDFIYIDDTARALRLIGENGRPFKEYVVGSGNARPLREFLLELKNEIAPELEFRFGSMPYSGINMPLSVFDCTDTERDCGFSAEIGFAEGCRRTYEWLKRNEEENGSGICF